MPRDSAASVREPSMALMNSNLTAGRTSKRREGAPGPWNLTNRFCLACVAMLFVCALASAQTNTNNLAKRPEDVHAACVEGRRYVCGKVLQILPDGLVVDSGYAELLKPPFNRSWVVQRQATVQRDPAAVEQNRPDAICIGTVFLTATPKKPAVELYDYVVLHAYPAGSRTYDPVPGISKTVRRFSGSLERAVELNLQSARK